MRVSDVAGRRRVVPSGVLWILAVTVPALGAVLSWNWLASALDEAACGPGVTHGFPAVRLVPAALSPVLVAVVAFWSRGTAYHRRLAVLLSLSLAYVVVIIGVLAWMGHSCD
jgi:hypothetical protein